MIQMQLLNCGFALESGPEGSAMMNLVDQDSKIIVSVPLPPDAVEAITSQFAGALTDEQKKRLKGLFETSAIVLPDRDFKINSGNFEKGPQG